MKHLISYIRPQFFKIAIGLSAKFVGTSMDLCIPWLLAYMIDEVVVKKDTTEIYIYGLLMIICAAIGLCSNIYANRNASAVGRDVIDVLRYDLYKNINILSSSDIDRLTVSSLISRLTTDMNNVHRTICIMQRLGVRAPLLLIGGIIVTSSLDWMLTLILVLMMPFIGLFIWFISTKGVSLYVNLQNAIDSLVNIIRQNIAGAKVIKALSKADYEKEKFRKINKDVIKKDASATIFMNLNQPVVNILFNTGLVLVVIVGAYRVNSGAIKVGVIVAFLSYFTIILTAMKSVTKLFILYFKANASAIRINEILKIEENLDIDLEKFDLDIEDFEINRACSEFHIEFKNVTFSYNKNLPAVENLSFKLRRGESLGVIGPIGSGKTTIMLLLMGFYKPDSGQILIDGVDIEDIDKRSLRELFGVVFQNDYLFSKSIYENIDFYRGYEEIDIEKTAELAGAIDFIKKKEDGLYEKISQRGGNLSGGQKQRLFLSRAFLSKPEILLLDDVSSGLDFATELKIRKNLFGEFKDSTKIIIESRVNSLKDCTKILVLQNGKVHGYDTHDNLLKNCELYSQINQIQNGDL